MSRQRYTSPARPWPGLVLCHPCSMGWGPGLDDADAGLVCDAEDGEPDHRAETTDDPCDYCTGD